MLLKYNGNNNCDSTFFNILVSFSHAFLLGTWGKNAAIPTNENNKRLMNPKLRECFTIGFGLLGFGLFILVKSEFIIFNLPDLLSNYGLWAIAVIFILRAIGEFKYVGFFKKIRDTPFGQMDTNYYSPLCLLIGVLIIIIELRK